MYLRAVIIVLVAGCGRIGFDEDEIDDSGGSLEADLVAHYLMEDTAGSMRLTDSSGHGLDGACNGGSACFAVVPGIAGNAVQVTGPGTVLVPDDPLLHLTTGFTVSIWLQRINGTTPISKPHLMGDGPAFEIVTGPTGVSFCTLDTLAVATSSCISTNQPLAMPWAHVAVTWDGTEKILYVEGTERLSELAGTMFDASPLSIGSDFTGGALSSQFTGAIDNVRIYSRALAPVEVAAIFARRL
ncbi:hypothetical protein BH11MYX3_BH11MYX3_13620 [soil metagenome]